MRGYIYVFIILFSLTLAYDLGTHYGYVPLGPGVIKQYSSTSVNLALREEKIFQGDIANDSSEETQKEGLVGIKPSKNLTNLNLTKNTISDSLNLTTKANLGILQSTKIIYKINQNSDDGTEANDIWYTAGYNSNLNYLGGSVDHNFIVGFRFEVPELNQSQQIKYARLRLASQGGEVTNSVNLLIKGVNEDSPDTFSESRKPSQLPKTQNEIFWEVNESWLPSGGILALYYKSPNIADIINEILNRPNWGDNGKYLILTIDNNNFFPNENNYLKSEDYSTELETRDPTMLEIYPTLADCFIGKPMLGRPTDTSVTINVINLLNIDIYAEYGTESGNYAYSTTQLLNQPAEEPIEIIINNLSPDTTYYYRIRYKEPAEGTYLVGLEGKFHTQRSKGAGFVFTIQADPQLLESYHDQDKYINYLKLYEQTLNNVASDNPDFHIDMGDFATTEARNGDASTQQEAIERYLFQRGFLDKITSSIPFYLVLGNHEGEQGWRAANDDDPLEIWGTLARKKVIPNPFPDNFYSGNQDDTTCCGLREDYYAWEWGDALFVVLDPFWYTTNKPHFYFDDGYPASNDGWDWTLGEEQYNWLYETLHNSDAKWKFVFSHHMTGGVLSTQLNTPYGRGGIEAAKYKVDNRPSFEWGGENKKGNYIFDVKRPGWSHGAIHDMMVNEGVDIFFHGHDHVFVYQTLDNITYQECPQPFDSSYSDGFYQESGYSNGVKFNNSGYLRVNVGPNLVKVDYVKSILPEDEPLLENGKSIYNKNIAYSYVLWPNKNIED